MVQANAIKHSNTDLDWFAATPEQVESAPCKKDAITLEKVNRAITLQINKAPRVDREIEGLWLEQQNSTMLDHLYDLLVPKAFDKKKIDDSDVRRAVNGGCRDIFCVLDTVFGYPQGRYIFYLKYKYGFNASHVAFNNSVVPTEEGLQAMIDGVSLYPDYIFPLILDQNKQMTKFKRGYYLKANGNNTYANALITFYDLWSDQGRYKKEYLVFHEVAHYLGEKYPNLENQWRDFYQCGQDENAVECYPSLYAEKNSFEDLAESIAAYRFNAKKFKKNFITSRANCCI